MNTEALACGKWEFMLHEASPILMISVYALLSQQCETKLCLKHYNMISVHHGAVVNGGHYVN